MTQQRGTVTDHLLNVIQVLQLGKKTGHLTVEREQNVKQEKGEILFVHGQVTQAYGGNLRGQDALNWLSDWGTCRYVFVPTTQEKVTDPLNKTPFTPIPPPRDKTTRSLPVTSPQKSVPVTNSHQSVSVAGSNSRLASPHPSNSMPVAVPNNGPARITQPQFGFAPLPIPYRIRSADDSLYILDRAGLSRAHRQLFLLIDGSRTVYELVRLTGRMLTEVQQMLQELKQIGVVQ